VMTLMVLPYAWLVRRLCHHDDAACHVLRVGLRSAGVRSVGSDVRLEWQAITACKNAEGKWKNAVELLEEMIDLGLQPNQTT
jgi:hypothetical protein